MKIHKCIVLVSITTLLFMFYTKEAVMAGGEDPPAETDPPAEDPPGPPGPTDTSGGSQDTNTTDAGGASNNTSMGCDSNTTDCSKKDDEKIIITHSLGTEPGTPIILFQYLRKPQRGKSLLNELLFLPREFYEKPELEEGYSLYGICHSAFNVGGGAEGGGIGNLTDDGAAGGDAGAGAGAAGEAGAGAGDEAGAGASGDTNANPPADGETAAPDPGGRRRRSDDANNDPSNTNEPDPPKDGNTDNVNEPDAPKDGNTTTDGVDDFDIELSEFEIFINSKTDKITFQYGMKKEDKMPDCKTRHKFDVFEKQEFQSLCSAKLYTVGLNISGKIITLAESCINIPKNKIHFVRYYLKANDPVPFTYIMPDGLDQSSELTLHDWDFREKKFRRIKKDVQNSSSAHEFRNLQTDFSNNILLNKVQKFKRDVNHIILSNDTLIRKKKALYIIFNATIEKNPFSRAFLPESYFKLPYVSDLYFLMTDIDETLQEIIGSQLDFLKFSRANLFPKNTFEPYIADPFENLLFLQSYIGWNNFVFGNWKILNEILRVRVQELADRNVAYNIYTGTSHIAEAVIPDCDDLKELGVKEFGKLKHIPKYVWIYIYSKQTHENFVIIGINSPYHPFFQNSDVFFCNDICDNISWLDPLKTLRKLNTFGRIFCCERRLAETVLFGFPFLASKAGEMSAPTIADPNTNP